MSPVIELCVRCGRELTLLSSNNKMFESYKYCEYDESKKIQVQFHGLKLNYQVSLSFFFISSIFIFFICTFDYQKPLEQQCNRGLIAMRHQISIKL